MDIHAHSFLKIWCWFGWSLQLSGVRDCINWWSIKRCLMVLQTHIMKRQLLLTHWGRVTHICVGKLTTIASDNGLSHGRRQAIIWTNVGMLLIRTLGTNFSEILSEIHKCSFRWNYVRSVTQRSLTVSDRMQQVYCCLCKNLNSSEPGSSWKQ